ncbi:MAG: TonB-dependent receptor [Chitinophagaceae bacterium]
MRTLFLSCVVLILAILFFNTKANSQTEQRSFQISGTIADSATQDSLPYITVSLKNSNNETVKVAPTQVNGYFEFAGLQRLLYHLTASSVGYSSKTIIIDLTDTTRQSMDLGLILITSEIKTLETATVTADRPIIKREADRISYDLEADPDSKSSSVLDMMRKVPFLSSDANGNILLKGSASYRIFINGKPSGMLTNNPKEILSAMPASSIRRIEVITIPPLKYDAEGLAGIINIILDKKVTNGVSGTLSVNGKFPQGGPGMGGSINIKQGKLGISGYGGVNRNRMPATDVFNSRNTFFSSPTTLIQNGSVRSNTRTGYLGTEISYEIDSLHLIAGSFNAYTNKTDGDNAQNSSFTDEDQILEKYSFDNRSKNLGNGFDAGLNYQLGFKSNKKRFLTLSYNYRTNKTDQTNKVAISNRVNYDAPDYHQFNTGDASEHTAQIDYIQPIKNLVIEAGVKGIFRLNNSDYQYYSQNTATKDFELDSASSNKFNNSQNVYGIYNSYTYGINKWTIKGGVRVEQTVTDANFISTATKVHQDYLHIIPSLAVNYQLKNNSSLNFGFNRRIKRPGISKLNPFVDRSNPNFESTGNPDLRPSLVNTVLLGYGISKKLNINIGMGYSFFSNLDFRVSEFDSSRNITRTTFKNIGKGSAYSLDVNINYPVTNRWNASLNSNLTYVKAEGISKGEIMKIDNLLYNINLSSGYNFDKGWRMNANLAAVGPNVVSLQAISNSMLGTSFTISKDLVPDILLLSAVVNNPFTKYRNNRIVTTGADFSETNITREYFRNYGFNLNFRFGKLKEGIKKNKRGINNTDLSNSKGGL